MNYFTIKLKSSKKAYGIRKYYPYTDKPFFKCLDDILVDESLQISLAHLFVELYKDELAFNFVSITKHKFIVPIEHQSEKFTKINNIICSNIANILGINLIDDYFDSTEIPRIDIRDEYTKDDYAISIKVNKKYDDIPVILFDCCCSTGIIFDYLSSILDNNENLYLTYGIRFNASSINNSKILEIDEYDFNTDKLDKKNPGYLVKIYGLFGNKNVEVDFRNDFSILIGENGYGKSTATRLALLALQCINNEKLTEQEKKIEENAYKAFFKDTEIISDIYKNLNGDHTSEMSLLSKFYFDKIKIYYSDYYIKLNLLDYYDKNDNIKEGSRVLNVKFGKGTVTNSKKTSCYVLFDDEQVKTKHMSKDYLILLDDNDEMIKNKYKVSLIDENNFCFHEQLVVQGGTINTDELKKFNLHDNKTISRLDNINSDICIKIDNFKFDYEIVEKFGNYTSSLVAEIKYSDVIPNKQYIFNKSENLTIKEFLDIISDEEYQNIIRKIILKDRSIEIDYKSIEMKYHQKFDFTQIDNVIRHVIEELKIKKDFDYIHFTSNLIGNQDQIEISLFNCAKSRNIVPPPSRDRIKIDYFENMYEYDMYEEIHNYYYDDVDKDKIAEIEKQMDEIAYHKEIEREKTDKIYNTFAWDYDDPEDYNPYEDDYDDYNPYEDDYDDYSPEDYFYDEFDNDDDKEETDDIEEELLGLMTDDEEDDEEDSYSDDKFDDKINDSLKKLEKMKKNFYSNVNNIFLYKKWNSSKIYFPEVEDCSYNCEFIMIRNILHNKIFNQDVETNFYNILKQIFEYNNMDFTENDLFEHDFFNISISKFLSDENIKEINKIYNNIFIEDYNFISFGIYDVLKNEDFVLFESIIKRLRSNGIVYKKDYLIVVGLSFLIESYKKTFISKVHILLEKLINKYLINKKAHVFANTIVINDLNNNYVPLDCLSTGERNLIILFSFCITNTNNLIILDEPDLSMSVAWQSKILIDLLRFTTNKYMVVSQSPLLIQKNNLATFVNRMEFSNDEINEIDLLELVTLIKKVKNTHTDDALYEVD